MGCTTGSPGTGDFQPGKAPAPPTAEVSSPRLLPPPESPPGLPRVTQSRARIASPPTTHRSARRNYRIVCARLMRSNYPPPLSSRRSAALGQRAVISCPSPAPELSPGSGSAPIGLPVAASCRTLGLPRGPRRESYETPHGVDGGAIQDWGRQARRSEDVEAGRSPPISLQL